MRLRPYIHTKDYKYLEKWVNDERVHAMWCANLLPYPVTEAGLQEILDKEAKERGGSAYVATDESGITIGFFVYSVNTSNNSGFFKFVILDNEIRGKGYGTQMLELALKYAFDITGVASVQLNVFDINGRAKRCYEKAGFVEDNVAKDAFRYKNECWGRCHMVALKPNAPFDCITDFIFVDNTASISPCDVILVPGGSHPQLMQKAAEIYRKGLAKYILVSGSKNKKLPNYPSEAAFLKEIAVKEGIPEDAIICEDKATNTYENALFSYEEIRRRGLDADKVILISKSYHSRRALFTYQKVFPATTKFFVASVTDNRGITRDNWFTKEEYVKIVMGEVEKMGKYFGEDILPMYLKLQSR